MWHFQLIQFVSDQVLFLDIYKLLRSVVSPLILISSVILFDAVLLKSVIIPFPILQLEVVLVTPVHKHRQQWVVGVVIVIY